MPSPGARWAIGALAISLLAGCAGDAPTSSTPPPAAATAVQPVPREPPPVAPWRGDPAREPPAPARFENPAIGRFHMRMHFRDLRRIEQLLLAGKLEDATALAPGLIAQIDDPGLARWKVHAKEVANAAVELAFAPGLDEALRRAPRIASACASCHADAQGKPVFPAPPPPLTDTSTAAARMARHVWATLRLWEGLVGPSDDRWVLGLQVLAATPLPFTALSDAPQLAAHMQQVARAQLATRPTAGLDDRAAAYGELLVTCAACHASLHVNVR